MDINSIKQQVENVVKDVNYSILSSKEEFDNSRSKLENPLLINEEVDYQKEIFSKLKFQYLEQETRDKFLRRISEPTMEDINRQDVKSLEMETAEKKQQLKLLKSKLYSQVNDLEKISEENILLQRDFQLKLDSTNEYIREIEVMEDQINNLVQKQSSETRELIDNLDLLDEVNINELLTNNQNRLIIEQSNLASLTNDLSLKKQINESNQQQLKKLNKKLFDLETIIKNFKPNEKPNKMQLFAKWCKEMNDMLIKFTPIRNLRLTLTTDDNINNRDFKLAFEINKKAIGIVFNNSFKIISYEGINDHDITKRIEQNNFSNDKFINELTVLINHLINKSDS